MKRSLLIAGWKWKVLIQNTQMLNFVAGEFVSFQLLFFALFDITIDILLLNVFTLVTLKTTARKRGR